MSQPEQHTHRTPLRGLGAKDMGVHECELLLGCYTVDVSVPLTMDDPF